MQRPRRDELESAPRTRFASQPHAPSIILLTTDTELLATLQEAAGHGHQFLQASSIEAAVELLLGGHCGIFIIDVALVGRELARLTDKLQTQFPEVVLLATGQRNDQHAIASLVTSGRIYRFLHKPVSPARAELFLSAAVRRSSELHQVDARTAGAGLTLATRPSWMLIGAVLAMVIVGAAWFLWPRGMEQPIAQPRTFEARPTSASADAQVQSLLTQAQASYRSGNALPPASDNALDAYRGALALDPSNTEARTGIARIVNDAAARVTAAIAAHDAPRATNELKTLKAIAPDDPRIESLQSELITLARSAQMKPAAPAPQIAARTVSDVPRTAEPRTPMPHREPEARAAGDVPVNVDREVEASVPGTGDVPTGEDAKAAAMRATNDRLAEVARLRSRGQLTEPAGENAYEILKALLEAGTATPETRLEQQRLSFALLEGTRLALAAQDIDRADVLATRAEEILPGLPQTKVLREQIGAARAERDDRNAIVQAASLPRRRQIPAVYPRDALLNKTQGWVDLEFVISTEGVPSEIRVTGAEPARVFDAAATEALRQWRFEPIVRNAVPQSRRAALRMEFKLKQ